MPRTFKERIEGAAHKTDKVVAKAVQKVGAGLEVAGKKVRKEGDLLADDAMRGHDNGSHDIEKGLKHFGKAGRKGVASFFNCCCPEEESSEDEAFISGRYTL